MSILDEPSRKLLPQRTCEDWAYAGRKGLASMIPFVGGIGSELLGLLSSPLAQRRDAWLEDLERRLRDLEGRVAGFRFDDLGANQQFISATLQATQDALRTNQQEKLEALRNAVVNVALGRDHDANRQVQFLSLVDRFSAAHLTLLRFFQDPAAHFERRGLPVPTLPVGGNFLANEFVSNAMPELREGLRSPVEGRDAASRQMIELFLNDLISSKLILLNRVNETWSIPRFKSQPTPYPAQPVTTQLGDDFLSFITEPRDEAYPIPAPACFR
jgi:hypothetical protein